MKKITRLQYERAKSIIMQYESQEKQKISHVFTEDDLEELGGSISIPYLTDKIVDDGYAIILSEKLAEKGYLIDYVSLDDLGYICVSYYSDYVAEITDKHISDLIEILNEIELKM